MAKWNQTWAKITASFSFKIYAVLLMVGVVPLIASYFLIDRVLIFNKDLQNEAISTLHDVSEYYKAWAQAEASKMKLIKENSQKLTQTAIIRAGQEARREGGEPVPESTFNTLFAEHFKEQLEPLLEQQTTLIQIEVKNHDKEVGSIKNTPINPETLKMKFETLHVAPPEVLRRQSTLFEVPPDISLHLVFAIDRSLADRYEILGEKRYIHRSLEQLENNGENSLSRLYQSFYLMMSAIVLFLTVLAALLITYPLGKRISMLSKATEKVAAGELDVQIQAYGKDELGQLMRQFNQMVTDVKHAQDSRAYVERMQAWQEVARRLAHEIKNPLTPLLLIVQQLERKFDDYKDRPERYRNLVEDVVEIVNEEAAILQKLVKEFSDFARLPTPDLKETIALDFIQQTLNLNPQLSEAAEIEVLQVPPPPRTFTLAIDRELMRRVFVNVLKNGIEACKNAGIEPLLSITISELKEKNMLAISIVDNGPGLTQSQKQNLFTPYFTTKDDGTGLGLPIVRKICQDHNGDIYLHDRKDKKNGVDARITLPLLDKGEIQPTVEEGNA